MIKKYINLFKFIKDLPQLKDCIIIFPFNIEEQFMLLNTFQSKELKRKMKEQNIKMIIERDRYNEQNESNTTTLNRTR